jgi:tetratricopeptide (TPR) repeat protein
MSESSYDNKLRPGYYENNFANMAAAFVVESERWELAAKLFPAATADEQVSSEQTGMSSHGGHGAAQSAAESGGSSGNATLRTSNRSQTLPLFIRGLAGAVNGSPEAATSLAGLKAMLLGNAVAMDTLEIRQLEIEALAASMKQDHGKAVELMKKATLLEEGLGPPSGPPGLIKPSHELFGEILLRADKPAEAVAQFRTALLRQPNRARSLLGAARAAAQSGDKDGAATAYAKLLDQWQQADESLPELREARDYVKKAKPGQ